MKPLISTREDSLRIINIIDSAIQNGFVLSKIISKVFIILLNQLN